MTPQNLKTSEIKTLRHAVVSSFTQTDLITSVPISETIDNELCTLVVSTEKENKLETLPYSILEGSDIEFKLHESKKTIHNSAYDKPLLIENELNFSNYEASIHDSSTPRDNQRDTELELEKIQNNFH